MAEPFVFANGQVAYNPEDLIKLCQQFPNDSVDYLIREDFEKWLSYIGASKVAQYAAEARSSAIDNEQKLSSFIAKFQAQSTPEVSQKTSQKTSQKANLSNDGLLATIVNFFRR